MRNWTKIAGAFLVLCLARPVFAGRPEAVGGGGEIPTPFDANQKVELAEGENYLLVGRVLIQVGSSGSGERYKAVFEVDFEEHPWLGSKRRRANPFYPLDGSASYWKQFRGMKIKLACQARGVVSYSDNGTLEHNLVLRRLNSKPVEPFGN